MRQIKGIDMLVIQILFWVIAAAAVAYYLKLWWVHMRIKGYFWYSLPNDKKHAVNYIWHLNVLFIDELPWTKRQSRFYQERNRILTEFDRSQTEELMRVERRLCQWGYFLFFLFLFGIYIFMPK